ncbi:MAG: hypothetical protein HC828_12100 [Blastochloris sp.]|nr:hypothetical protein [Blastochloris sp.]
MARDRLLTVLVHDRVKLTPDMLDQLKAELSAVIARYVPSADSDAIEVSFLRGESNDYLKADFRCAVVHNKFIFTGCMTRSPTKARFTALASVRNLHAVIKPSTHIILF